MELDLHRQVNRANFVGLRPWTVEMAGAAQARPETPAAQAPAARAPTATGSKVALTQLRHVPDALVAGKEAAFELTIENGPRVPTFSWYFGVGPASQANAWTEVTQTRFTYMNPGTYTIRVTVRDKNRYAQGVLAEGSWQITVAPE
jgi:hypothetical protein